MTDTLPAPVRSLPASVQRVVDAPPLPVDDPVTSEGGRVVILGGGFSGVATAIQLLRTGRPDLRLTLVERTGSLGRGVAFDTPFPEHTLNVPAIGMVLDPAAPRAFYDFVRRSHPEVRPHDLVSRRLFGDFVQATLVAEARRAAGRLRVLRDDVVDVIPGPPWEVVLASGTRLPAAAVVLATGHLSSHPPGALPGDDPRVVADPWTPGAIDAIPPDERVLVVGTGLTAVDVLRTLRARGHRGPVVAVSRRGRWPARHLEEVVWTGSLAHVDPETAPTTAAGLARWARAEVERHKAAGIPWKAVIDVIRGHTTRLWERLPHEERLRFLSDVRPEWELVRHRMHRDHVAGLGAWENEGGLRRVSAEVVALTPDGDERVATFRTADGLHTGRFDRGIHCAGQLSDVTRSEEPLWRQLLGRALVVPDEERTGVRCDDAGRALDRAGAPTGLFVLGSWCRPNRWESTAAPDLALRASHMVPALLASLPVPGGVARAR